MSKHIQAPAMEGVEGTRTFPVSPDTEWRPRAAEPSMTEVATLTLAEFLTARIDEDEKVARIGLGDPKRQRNIPPAPTIGRLYYSGGWGSDLDVLASPGYVLAECEAKRRIVALHPQAEDGCVLCTTWDSAGAGGENWPCRTLRALALPYASHPDFRPEWRP